MIISEVSISNLRATNFKRIKLNPGTNILFGKNGIGKRTSFDDYRQQSRGGKGVITMKCTEKTGQVVGAAAVADDDELMLMTTGGQSIRIRVSDVRETGRNAQGVKLVTLNEEEKLQDIAPVRESSEEESEAEEPEAEETETEE